MKTTLYSISLALLLFLFGCQPKNVYNNIDPATKIKFKQNDTLLFISALRTDSFKIAEIVDQSNEIDKQYYEEVFDVFYDKLHFTQSNDSIFRDGSYYIDRFENVRSIEWRNLYDDIGYYNKTDTVFIIGNITIDSVKVFNATSKTDHYLNDVKKVCYCDLYGVIEYERYDGEKFILDSKCISKYIK